MFQCAIVATDLGPSSEAIVACSGTLGALGVRRAVLVHAISLDRPLTPADDAAFERQIAALDAAGISVTVETPLGYAPHAITEIAGAHSADLIVMGTQGKGLFHTGFSGSVSSDVIRLSQTPVLLAPSSELNNAEQAVALCGRALASVLVPVDFTPLSERAFALACSLSPADIGRLTIVHVIESTFEALRDGKECAGRARLDVLAERARSAGITDVRTELRLGEPDASVAELTTSGDFTMIVLAPRCLDTIDQEFGSVTNAVIRDCPVPILLAPPRCDKLAE